MAFIGILGGTRRPPYTGKVFKRLVLMALKRFFQTRSFGFRMSKASIGVLELSSAFKAR